MNPKWPNLNYVLKRIFTKDLVSPQEDPELATLVSNDFTVAILEDMSSTIPNTIKVMMRACLVPHDAARLIIGITAVYPVIFGPHFEFDDKGNVIQGEKAMEIVWGHQPLTILESLFDEKILEKQYKLKN